MASDNDAASSTFDLEQLWGAVPYVLFGLAILVLCFAYKEELGRTLRSFAKLFSRERRK